MHARSNHFVLHPGDVVIAERGDSIETLLGSCVTVILTDPRRTVGAVCHVVHTVSRPASSAASVGSASVAFACMDKGLRGKGIVASMCEAYVYGGGHMFPDRPDVRSVGDDNGAWVLGQLQMMGVRLMEVDLGGSAYRKLKWTVGPSNPEVQHHRM